MGPQVAQSLGEGLGLAVLFYPLTWLVMRKQFNAPRFSKLGFGLAVVLLPTLRALGAFGQEDTQMGMILAALGPITICSALVVMTRIKP